MPIGLPDPPILAVIGVIAFGVIANVFYTGGWIVELLVAKVWHVESARFGPNLAVAALTRCRDLT